MFRRLRILLILSLCLCCLVACQFDLPGADPTVNGVPTTDGVADDYSVSLTEMCVSTDVTAYEVLGISRGFVCVFGEYNGRTGMFYVSADGKVLGDHVFNYTRIDFQYLNGEGYFVYVRLEDGSWRKLYENGELSDETFQDPISTPFVERYMEEIDGQELWGVRDIKGNIVIEPTYSWIEGMGNYHYNYAVTAEDQPVLIDYDGVVQVTLPTDCSGILLGSMGFVAKYRENDARITYGLLDFSGKPLSEERYECLTTLEKYMAAGVQDGQLALVNDRGVTCLRTDIAAVDVAFDGDIVAAALADGTLGVYKVSFDRQPLRRVALDLVERAASIQALYNQSGNAGGNGVEGEDYLKEGTTLEHMGQSVTLECDYELYTDYFPDFRVSNWAELEAAVESVYTRDTAVRAFYTSPSKYAPHFINYKGKAFGILAEGAYCGEWDGSTLRILSKTEDTVCFSIGCYLNYPTEDGADAQYFCMRKTENGWRLDSPGLGYSSSENMQQDMAYCAFLRSYATDNGADSAGYFYADIDGKSGDELLLTTSDCRMLVYTYADGAIKEVDSWKYQTATTKFLRSGDRKYPGIVVYFHGEQDQLRYMSVVDGSIVFEDVLKMSQDGTTLSENTEDITLIDLAKQAYAENNIYNCYPLPG